jgi:hypothetical protein
MIDYEHSKRRLQSPPGSCSLESVEDDGPANGAVSLRGNCSLGMSHAASLGPHRVAARLQQETEVAIRHPFPGHQVMVSVECGDHGFLLVDARWLCGGAKAVSEVPGDGRVDGGGGRRCHCQRR